MKHILIAATMALFLGISYSTSACQTGLYTEIGAGWNTTALEDQDPWNTPLGSIEFGWMAKHDWSLSFKHESSLPNIEDSGLDVFWLKKRIWLYEVKP